MCGIAGIVDRAGATPTDELSTVADTMAARLAHRGPDQRGLWTDPDGGVALGFRRLAIVDLTPTGHQPMLSRCGRFAIVFNGEIYNYRDLRRCLEAEGRRFAGESDTEVLVEAIARWGTRAALQRCNGMFAFALWDAQDRRLTLARDRLGEKPLYFGRAGQHLIFASELKAIRAHPSFDATVDRGALSLYLRYSYIPSPFTIYRHARKLAAGSLIELAAGNRGSWPPPEKWWALAEVAAAGAADRFGGTEREAADELERLLSDAVGLRLHADVALGAFLSGGVDSSTVVAMMQARSSRPVRTFTVAMPEAGLDESGDAAAVASHLGTDHTEVSISPGDALALIPTLPERWDEPFSDPSQVPTAIVCGVARDHVTVCLSGDGGDEVFGGYNRYLFGRLAWERAGRLPLWARQAAARALAVLGPRQWDALVSAAGPLTPRHLRVRNAGEKVQKLASVLGASSPAEVYGALVTQWASPARLIGLDAEPVTELTGRDGWPALPEITEQMMFADTVVSLPDDMLTKVDRASMSVGLEARVPLLDHRLVEFAWRLPPEWKVGPRQGKHLLRQVLYRHVPAGLIERPKLGFDPPIGTWLRGPLRAWAEDLLGHRALEESFDDPGPIHRAWSEHLAGRQNHDYRLWGVLMFEAWRRSVGV